MNKQLHVYLSSELVGRLELSTDDKMTFTYSKSATRPISVAMPVAEQTFDNQHCEAFFGGLLPESDEARKALGRRFKISPHNTFSLLRSIGAECAGALSILESGSPAPIDQPGIIRTLPEAELAAHIRELPQRPLFIGVDGIRLSLAGVQDKASVCVTEGGIGLPAGGPTTHILKPDVKAEPGVIYCEHLCMKVAKQLGLNAAEVALGRAEDLVYLLVERYDRQPGKSPNILERIHQEDFCQALKIPSSRKYQEEGGPRLIDCFELLSKTAVPAKDRINLLNAVTFNFLVSNLDAHAKNFSLLHSSNGIRLAPLYDLICTAAFPNYAQSLAMDIGDYFEPEEIHAHNWRVLCADINFSFPAFKKAAASLYKSLPSEADKVYKEMELEGWSHPACERTLDIIKTNCDSMKVRLSV